MKYNTKSVIIGRKKKPNKDAESCPCFVAFYSMNNPHTSGTVPDQIVEYEEIHKVVITGLDLNYLLLGNDLVINDLVEIDVEMDNGHVYVKGVQENQ